MPSSSSSYTGPRRRGPVRPGLAALLCTAAVGLLLTGAAVATSGTRVVSSSANQTLGKAIVVEARGRTLYALSPETTHHLLCKSPLCLHNWPPLTVHSANVTLRAGSGVQGRLGVLRRSVGQWQVTLRGLPLYRFAGDTAKGQANGEGIKAFGGTWHAVTSATHPTAAPVGEPKPVPSSPAPAPAPYPY